jgi:prepilin-type N-terminal cleavage/methylation domain-containing protein
MRNRSSRCEKGFSLVELLVVVGLAGVLGSMAVLQIAAVRPGMVGDGAMRVVMGRLNQAREEAIAHRRRIDVTFVGNNAVRLTRIEIAPKVPTVLATVPLEGGVRFQVIPEIEDTPDKFGKSASPSFSGVITFNTDGMLINSAGSPVNGTVFLLLANQPLSYRAVTILGSTGRVRGYKWNGKNWTRA